MQLFLNATSPFARLARTAALEKQLANRMELVWCDPWNNDPQLLAHHPQARIPLLVTDTGAAIAESLLIAQWLDQSGSGPALVPAAHAADVLAATSMAYGLMEAAFQLVIARKYDGTSADQSVLGQRRVAAITRALALLEQRTPASATLPAAPITLDGLATAIAWEYLLFRLPELLPAAAYPRRHAWWQTVAQRPSLRSTAFA